ncbi:MAG: phage integrase SAM-like domain-containing protein [Muribaculaceae bacterium]|nr:phage integrase SAM-like domain-containing protein [Muribaculaceae bacterium]
MDFQDTTPLDYFCQTAEQTPGTNARNYRYLAGAWKRFRPEASWTDITPDTVACFDRFMTDDMALSPTTRARYLQVLRALCRRAVRAGIAPAPLATAFAAVSSKRPVARPTRPHDSAPAAPHPAPVRWYAFRLMRHTAADNFFAATAPLRLTTYYPTAEISRRIGGALRKTERPVLPSIIFIHTAADNFDAIRQAARQLGHFIGHPAPTPIPDDQMRIFALVIGSLSPGMTVAEATDEEWEIGRHVTITDGPFAGYSGLVADAPEAPGSMILIRLLHHRLKVTAHIPTQFLTTS